MEKWFDPCEGKGEGEGHEDELFWVRSQSTSTRNGDLGWFVDNVVPKIDHKFSLITSDGAASLPGGEYYEQKLLGNPWLQRWYMQDYGGVTSSSSTNKAYIIPVGFDLHSHIFRENFSRDPMRNAWSRSQKIDWMVQLRGKALLEGGVDDDGETKRKLPPALGQSSELEVYLPPMSSSSQDRIDAVQLLHSKKCRNEGHIVPAFDPRWGGSGSGSGCTSCLFPSLRGSSRGRMTQEKLWESYSTRLFALSPRGTGLDSHRTWELLFFGAVPIVKSSSLDPLYAGLPVIILDDWSDLCEAGTLERKWDEVKAFWPVKDDRVFTTQYWLEKGVKGA